MSSTTSVEAGTREVANYGGLIDAIGGVAAVVLAIIGLAGTNPSMLLAITTIVFAAALLIQSGTILSELTHMIFPAGAEAPTEEFSAGGLSIVFLVGSAGLVLGVLALIGIYTDELSSIAVIAFGAALVFGSNAVWSVHRMKQQSAYRTGSAAPLTGPEILATEMAAGSAAVQCIGGVAAVVLGILAITGTKSVPLSLIGLLVMGATLLLTGSTLSGVVQGFMRPTATYRRTTGLTETPAE